MKSPCFFLLLLAISLLACQEPQASQRTPEEKKSIINKILWDVAWSPDGKWMATGGSQGTLKIYEAQNFSLNHQIPVDNTITKISWHPQENLLTFSTQDPGQPSGILDMDSKKLLALDSIASTGARGLDWHPSGELLAVGDNEGDLIIYNKAGKVLKKLDSGLRSITGLDWHPTKKSLAFVSGKIAIYDFAADSLQTFKNRPEPMLLLALAWHPSGDFFVTGDYGDPDKGYPPLLQFWDPQGQLIRTIENSKAEYRNIAWSQHGSYLATASEALRIWSKEGTLLHEGPSENLLWGIAWGANDQRLISSDIVGRVVLWDAKAQLLEVLQKQKE